MFLHTIAILVDRYDWPYWPQTICLRREPVLQPSRFLRRVRAVVAKDYRPELLRGWNARVLETSRVSLTGDRPVSVR